MTAPPSTASVRARPLSVHIHTSIDIHADADAVWTVMADTAAYATGARSSAASTASLPSATGSASRCNWTAADRKRSPHRRPRSRLQLHIRADARSRTVSASAASSSPASEGY